MNRFRKIKENTKVRQAFPTLIFKNCKNIYMLVQAELFYVEQLVN